MLAEHPEFAPGGASHRDARRIGPVGFRPALARHLLPPSLIPPGRRSCGARAFRLAAGAASPSDRQPLRLQLAIAGRPACGVACAGGLSCDRASRCNPRRPPARRPVPSGVARMDGKVCLAAISRTVATAWRFRDRFSGSPPPPLPIPWSKLLRPGIPASSCRKNGQTTARHSQASAVRQARPEGRTRRVFRYCCGHRRRLDFADFHRHFRVLPVNRGSNRHSR